MARISVRKHYSGRGSVAVGPWDFQGDRIRLEGLKGEITLPLPAVGAGDALVHISMDSGYDGVIFASAHPALLGQVEGKGDKGTRRLTAVYHFRLNMEPAVIVYTAGRRGRRFEAGLWWDGARLLFVEEARKVPRSAPWTLQTLREAEAEPWQTDLGHYQANLEKYRKVWGEDAAAQSNWARTVEWAQDRMREVLANYEPALYAWPTTE